MTDPYIEDIEKHQAARERRLLSPNGWLALVGKVFLHQGTARLGSDASCEARLPEGAPPLVGTLTVEGRSVRLDVAPGVAVKLDREARAPGEAVVSSHVLRSDRDGSADTLVVADYMLQLMERGDALALRVRDRRGAREAFAGIDRFPIDAAWVKEARLVPHASPTRIEVEFEGGHDDVHAGSIAQDLPSPGRLAFDIDGATHHLEAFLDDGGKRLFVLFRDATTGSESYELGRFFYAPLPGADGTTLLDFNLSMLPGCAFSTYATCPIPPRANYLALPVRAGEKRYLGRALGS